jgi:hypothetical protein
MNRSQIHLGVLGILLQWLMCGCANYGTISPALERGEKPTIRELQESWKDYSIHYADWRSVGWTGGVIFDPKSDEKTLGGKRWTKVEDQETLAQLIASIEARHRYPRLHRIFAPNDEFYGYMYLGPRRDYVTVSVRATAVNSLEVSDLQPRILGVR